MASSISNALNSANAYQTQQLAQPKMVSADVGVSATTESSSSSDTATVSTIAQQMAAQAKTWSTFSRSDLQGIHDRAYDTITKLDDKFLRSGMSVFDADITTGTPEQISRATTFRNYMVALHSSPPTKVSNPYSGLSREVLSSILYDESGAHSTSEKYAAFAEQSKQDYEYFSMLGASATASGDHRQFYQGVVNFYDALSPVEQSVYPLDFKQQVSGFLKQQETLFGVLYESSESQPMAEDVASVEDDESSSAAIQLKRDEPIWSQLVEIVKNISTSASSRS
jgi:hypothetical protein